MVFLHIVPVVNDGLPARISKSLGLQSWQTVAQWSVGATGIAELRPSRRSVYKRNV